MATAGGATQRRDPREHRAWTPLARALAATGDRWTLLIVLALASGRMRLTRLQSQLPGVSTGVLERYVQRMTAIGLVTRTRFREMPPRVEVELTDSGRELVPVAGALAQWGMRNRWSPPGQRERIDVSALLRMLPALLTPLTGVPHGCIEVMVTGTDPPVACVLHIQHGHLRMLDGAAEAFALARDGADAGVEGDEQAWIAALGPSRDFSGLRITGDERLIADVIGALPGQRARRSVRDAPGSDVAVPSAHAGSAGP